jgi:hypothetical protein
VKRRAARLLFLLSTSALVAAVGACSFILTGDGLVGPGPSEAGTDDGATADALGDGRACTQDCKGNPCVSGECAASVIVDSEPGATGLAIDATHLYWTREDGQVRRRGIGGGAIETLAEGEKAPGYVALEAQHVYWTASGKIRRAKKESGPAEDVASTTTGPFGVAAAGGELCWTEGQGANGVIACRGDGGSYVSTSNLTDPRALTMLFRRYLALGNGTIVTFGFGSAPVVVVDDANAAGIFLADPWLYWASPKSGVVARVSTTDGKREILARDAAQPTGIVADSTAVHFTEPKLGRIRKLKL